MLQFKIPEIRQEKCSIAQRKSKREMRVREREREGNGGKREKNKASKTGNNFKVNGLLDQRVHSNALE